MKKIQHALSICGILAITFLAFAVQSLSENLSFQRQNSTATGNLEKAMEEMIFPEALAGFGTDTLEFFNEYSAWPSSASLKTDDNTAQILGLLRANGRIELIDFNGDGLVDVLYHERLNGNSTYPKRDFLGIFLNNGSGFEDTYKCAHVSEGNDGYVWYGDCADV